MRVWSIVGNIAVDALDIESNFILGEYHEFSLHLNDDDYEKLAHLSGSFDGVCLIRYEGELILFPVDDVYTHKKSMLLAWLSEAKSRGIVFKSLRNKR